MEGRESDRENVTPEPSWAHHSINFESEEDLSKYRIILAPVPAPRPTPRQIKDAVRCMRSGMVPGVMRKYLMQKKKPELEGLEEEDDGSADSSTAVSSLLPLSNNINNNNNNEISTQQPTKDEDDNDGIHILGEFLPLPLQNSSEDEDQAFLETRDPLALDDDAYNNICYDDSNANECNLVHEHLLVPSSTSTYNKRCYSQAFSPDTTTPNDYDEEQINFREKTEKKARLETTPSNHSDSSSNENNDFGASVGSPVPGTSGTQGRRKYHRTAFTEEREIESPQIQHARRNLEKTLSTETSIGAVVFEKAESDPKLDNQIKKNNWKPVLVKFNSDLKINIVPQPCHVGDLIRKAILSIGTRVSRGVPEEAYDFFKILVTKYPIDCNESMDFYKTAFTSSVDECSMTEFLFIILESIQADVQAKVTPKALPFFKTLTKMVVNQYKNSIKRRDKLASTTCFFALFMEKEEDQRMTYNIYCQKLLRFMFSLINHPEELKPVLRWIGLLSHHLRNTYLLDKGFMQLVTDFVETVSKPEFSACQIPIVQAISDKKLGSAVCLALLRKKIQFENSNGSGEPKETDITKFIKTLSESDLITGLKSGLKERRRPDDQMGPQVVVFPTAKKSKKQGVNMRGESYLHTLCRKAKGDSAGIELEKFLKSKNFNVNPRDNNGNTPLHDSVAHDRFDALVKFFNFCSDPFLPDELRIDILAQTKGGDTAFHLAAASKTEHSMEMIETLIYIADKLQVKDEALKMLNHEGKMPFQMAYTDEIKTALKPKSIMVELPYIVGNVKVSNLAETKLQSIEVKRLIALWSEFSSQD